MPEDPARRQVRLVTAKSGARRRRDGDGGNQDKQHEGDRRGQGRRVDTSSRLVPPEPVTYREELRRLLPKDGENVATCTFCHEPFIYGVAQQCVNAYAICWLCSARWRRIETIKQTSDAYQGEGSEVTEKPTVTHRCCLCSQDLSLGVVISKEREAFAEISMTKMLLDVKSGMYCHDSAALAALKEAQCWRCWNPDCQTESHQQPISKEPIGKQPISKELAEKQCAEKQCAEKEALHFQNYHEWCSHMESTHNLVPCDICVDGCRGSLFPAEFPLFSPDELARHRREGTRTGVDAHVRCRVCGKWLFDSEAYGWHWRQSDNHFACSLCHQDGFQHVLFSSFQGLTKHFAQEHHPCVEESCETKQVVFKTYRDLQLHMAKEHFKNSEFYQNTGKRGIRVNLDSMRSEHRHTHQASPSDQEERLEGGDVFADNICNLWPLEMIAESAKILGVVKRASEQTAEKAAKEYKMVSPIFFRNSDKEERVRTECSRLAKSGREEVIADVLNQIARLIWETYLEHVARIVTERGLQSSDQLSPDSTIEMIRPESVRGAAQAEWLLGPQSHMTRASEVFCLILLCVNPKTMARTHKTCVTVLEKIATRTHSASLYLKKHREDATEKDGDTAAGERRSGRRGSSDSMTEDAYVLSNCERLIVGRFVTFAVAVEWAMREYIIRRGWDGDTGSSEIPGKVALSVIDRMRSIYTKVDLERFTHIVRDLKDYISTQKLERFLGLRPAYLRIQMSTKIPGQEPDREVYSPLQASKLWVSTHRAVCISVYGGTIFCCTLRISK